MLTWRERSREEDADPSANDWRRIWNLQRRYSKVRTGLEMAKKLERKTSILRRLGGGGSVASDRGTAEVRVTFRGGTPADPLVKYS
jgi:hypothetical protein